MEKVRAGEQVVLKASTWNAFIDAANFVRQSRQNQMGKGLSRGLGVGIIPIKNMESTDFGRFSAMVLNGVCVKPETNEDEFVSCPAVFQGYRMTEDREDCPYAILLEPVASGEIGRAMLLGITPAKVTIADSDDKYAVPTPNSSTGALESSQTGVARILWKEGNSGSVWCVLQLGGAGAGGGEEKALMCRVSSGNAQSGYKVAVYPNGRSDEGSSYYSTLFVPDIALDADLPAGTWIIGHKALLASTGGND